MADKLTPAQIVTEINSTWVNGVSVTEGNTSLKSLLDSVDPRSGASNILFELDGTGAAEEGDFAWSSEEGSATIGMPGGNVNLNVGMESFLPRRVKNASGVDMKNGSLVYISSGTGVNSIVSLANASSHDTASKTIAMLTEDIDNDSFGWAATSGIVRGSSEQPINTSAYSAGDDIFLSDSTSGGFEPTFAEHPSYAVHCGSVFRSHATEGMVVVRISPPVCACRIAGGDRATWDDLRFPFVGKSIDTASGRLDYNYFNCAVGFQSNARYPEEPVCSLVQMPHHWLEGSELHPHIHWIQQSSDVPNWLIAYRVIDKNTEIGIQTDFSNYTLAAWSSNAFTYTSGSIHQLTEFPAIDMTGSQLSDCIQVVIFRDSANVSGEFAGSDPSSATELIFELDIHYKIDSLGSREEYVKG